MPGSREVKHGRRPYISYLMTAYRSEAYLPEAIASVQAQTISDWELVVVDNGNSDTIADLVRQHQRDPRITLVRQKNRGYRGGVAAAAAVARGQYLCVLDSDDRLAPNHAEAMSSFLDEYPDADAVGCDAHQFLDGERATFGRGYLSSLGRGRAPARGHRLRVADVLDGWVPYYSSAISRRAWDAVGGYEPGLEGVDESVVIWLRLADRFDARLVPEKLAYYRVRENSLSRDPAKVAAFEDALIRSFELYSGESEDAALAIAAERNVSQIRYLRALRQARWAFQDGDVALARESARQAWGLRRTSRAAVALCAVTIAPRLASAAYPAKQRAAAAIRRLGQRTRPVEVGVSIHPAGKL